MRTVLAARHCSQFRIISARRVRIIADCLRADLLFSGGTLAVFNSQSGGSFHAYASEQTRLNGERIMKPYRLSTNDGIIQMGFDQKGNVVIKVRQGANGQWDVNETGFEKPLATFESKDKAIEYANDIAKTKGGSRVELA